MFKHPKFLITRFTHGAGGKFLSSVLQTSKNVDHWNNLIESYKNHPLYCNFKNLPTILKYNNSCTFSIDEKARLIEEKIIKNHTCEYYKDQNNFLKIDPEYNIKNIFIPLSSFFNFTDFLNISFTFLHSLN